MKLYKYICDKTFKEHLDSHLKGEVHLSQWSMRTWGLLPYRWQVFAISVLAILFLNVNQGYSSQSDLVGTTWSGKDADGDFWKYEFKEENKFIISNAKGESAEGTWLETNNTFLMQINNRQMTFEARLANGTLEGTANLLNGGSWRWSATIEQQSTIEKPLDAPATPQVPQPAPIIIPIDWGVNWNKIGSVRDFETVKLSHAQYGMPQDFKNSENYCTKYIYSYDNKIVARLCATSRQYIDITGSIRSRISAPNIESIAFSPDNKTIAVSYYQGNEIGLFELASGKLLSKHHFGDSTYAVSFSPNGKYIIASDKLIDIADWKVVREFKKTGGSFVQSAIFTPDGKYVAIGRYENNYVEIFNTETGVFVYKLPGGAEILAFSEDKTILYAQSGHYTSYATAWIYEKRGLYGAEYAQLGADAIKYNDLLQQAVNIPRTLELEKKEEVTLKLGSLKGPRGEFEKSSEYAARQTKLSVAESQIDNKYAKKLTDALYNVDQEKQSWNKLLASALYPIKLAIQLGSYDPDTETFSATLFENKFSIPVPRDKAVELSKQKDTLSITGKVRHYNNTHVELLNAYLADDATSNKFAFGTHLEPIMVAATEKTPPQLIISSLEILEPSANGMLDAGEKGKIRFVLKNTSKSTAFGVNAKFDSTSPLPAGVSIEGLKYLGVINGGEEIFVEADITASEDVEAADIQLKAQATETNGFDAKPVMISFKSKALVPPILQIASVNINSSDGKRVLSKGVQADLVVHVQNAGNGVARSVSVALNINSRDIVAYGSDSIKIGDLAPGKSKEVVFSIAVNQRYQGSATLPITFIVKEERPRFNANPDIKLVLHEEISEIRTVKVEARESAPAAALDDLSPPTLLADELLFGNNDHAVIIGIEHYRNNLPKADFAYDDAKLVKAYFRGLGIPERNIDYLIDDKASFNDLKIALETRLKNRVRPNSRVIVYYSGHGAPEPSTGQAFLVPYDGNPSYLPDTGYPLKRLYDNLAQLNVRETMVLLDACFSGIGGRSVLASGARALVRIDKSTPVTDNMLVLSSSQGAQISTSFPEKKHGLFTYFFLKAIKDGKKDIASVYESVKPLVEDESKRQNVEQSPTVTPSLDKIQGRFTLRK